MKAMQELDTDGSGEVDFEEFSVWWPKYCARLTSTRNRSGFDGVLGSAVDEVASQQSEERVQFDAQLLQVVKFMEGKDASELKVEFEGLVRRHQTCRENHLKQLYSCRRALPAQTAEREQPVTALRCCNCCMQSQDADNSGELDLSEVLALVQKVFGALRTWTHHGWIALMHLFPC